MKIYLAWIGIVCVLFSCQKTGGRVVRQGETTLAGLEGEEMQELGGNWLFYPGATPDSLPDVTPVQIAIPGAWRGNYFLPNALAAKGYGMFELRIANPQRVEQLALGFSDIVGCAHIYVNGHKKYEQGDFNIRQETGSMRTPDIVLPLETSEVYTVQIYVSSYTHRMGGGMLKTPVIASETVLDRRFERHLILESILFSVSLLVIATCLVYFFFVQRNKTYIYFILFCFSAALRQFAMGGGLISYFFGAVSYELIQDLRYIGYLCAISFGALFFYHLYESLFSRRLTNFVLSFGIGVSLFNVFTPGIYGSYLAIPIQLFGLVTTLFYFYKILLKRKLSGRFDYWVNAVYFFFLLSIVYDILRTQFLVHAPALQNTAFAALSIVMLLQIIESIRRRDLKIADLNTEISDKMDELSFREKDLENMLIANETQNAEARQLIHTLNGIIHSDQHIAEKTEQIARVIRQYKLLLALENPDTSELKFSNTHFKQRLSEAYPELSRNEIEICLLVRLNYSYKEIASKRKVSDQAVKVNMFRIRKKIGVESNTALSQILLEI